MGVVPLPVRILIGLLLALALLLALRSRLADMRARRLDRQREALLEDVGLLQTALLPVPPAQVGPVMTSAAYRPADGPAAGGDFYDLFAMEDGKVAAIVGDISGHGRGALPHTALVRFTLRAYLEAGLSPRAAVQTAGAALERTLRGTLATVAVATYDPNGRRMVYACAGHPPPLAVGSSSMDTVTPLTLCSAPPIGAGMRTGSRQTTIALAGSSRVCLHTDGLTEARTGGELFGSERLAELLVGLGPDATASALLDRVTEHTDARPDDMAACVLSIEGPGEQAPKVVREEIELDRDSAMSERTRRFLLKCGLSAGEAGELMEAAHRAAGRSGTVLVSLSFDAGHPPQAAIQRTKLTTLPPPGLAAAPAAEVAVAQ